MRHFNQTLQERPITRDVSSFDGGLSSVQKSQFMSMASKRIGLNKTLKSTQTDQTTVKSKQKLMDRKHAQTSSKHPVDGGKDFKIFNTVSFKRTEP